jgi:hypothetical protein
MINFTQRDRQIPAVLMIVATIILCASLLYAFLVPPPTTEGLAESHKKTAEAIAADTKTAQDTGRLAIEAVSPHLGASNPELVTAAVLAELTTQSQQQSLQMTAFRPDRGQALDGIVEERYTVQITGTYPAVRAALTALDHNSKIVVRSVQIQSTEQASGAVTALLGLSAYMPVDPQLVSMLAPAGAPSPKRSVGLRNVAQGSAGALQTGGEHG